MIWNFESKDIAQINGRHGLASAYRRLQQAGPEARVGSVGLPMRIPMQAFGVDDGGGCVADDRMIDLA
ncbi:MAG: hypothetical protein R6V60_10395 [Desulfobacterales bacterium]